VATGPEVLLTRRPGCPFDDARAENYAQARADGCTIHVASEAAGIDYRTGRKIEVTGEVRGRIREIRPAQPTRSPIWFLEMAARNAEMAQERAARCEKDNAAAELIKASTLALAEGRKILLETEGLVALTSGGQAPLDDTERAALRRRLSTPITVPGQEISRTGGLQ
jgi:hypothetical protein